MISVEDALNKLLSITPALPTEYVHLSSAAGRILTKPVKTERSQPPFSAAAMDGYAIKASAAFLGQEFEVIGEASAGHRFKETVNNGQAVRIFTGAPLPIGTDFVVIQEDIMRQGNKINIRKEQTTDSNVRPKGGDFCNGSTLTSPRILSSSDIALLAAMNIANVPVSHQPDVALIATGDELVMPGENPDENQIFASNIFGLKAMLEEFGARCRILPIARDNAKSLKTIFNLASDADLMITIGGASVGDYDIVGDVTEDLGIQRSFYKVAMRPGKPLMAGSLLNTLMIGLPGNPVSAMVCGHIFLRPVILRMQGLQNVEPIQRQARIANTLAPNGARMHFMRAIVKNDKVRTFNRQDSSLLSILAQANALVVRPPHDPIRSTGCEVNYLPI
ncbi:MAG: molybdopterin molybdotransferase MoeA [Aestuariivita sp.]|nr:molybdopterin molybdotransferase MoeA [Aestuariivita sp.]